MAGRSDDPKGERVTVRLQDRVLVKIDRLAKKKKMNRSEAIRHALENWAENNQSAV